MISDKNKRWINYHKKNGATFHLGLNREFCSCWMKTRDNMVYSAEAKTLNKAISECADNFVNSIITK